MARSMYATKARCELLAAQGAMHGVVAELLTIWSRCAQRQRGGPELASGSSTPCWLGGGVMVPRRRLCGAQHIPYRTRWTRGSGTSAASFSSRANGASVIPQGRNIRNWFFTKGSQAEREQMVRMTSEVARANSPGTDQGSVRSVRYYWSRLSVHGVRRRQR